MRTSTKSYSLEEDSEETEEKRKKGEKIKRGFVLLRSIGTEIRKGRAYALIP